VLIPYAISYGLKVHCDEEANMRRKRPLQSQKKISSATAGNADFRHTQGVTLVEAVLAISILAITALGALSYQYHAARHSRISRELITATRTAQLLLEDWKSTGGANSYNPALLGLGFSSPTPIPEEFSHSEVPGSVINDSIYTITVDGVPMTVMLKWQDLDNPYGITEGLRELTIIISFEDYDAGNSSSTSALEDMPPIIMATYVRLDETSG